MTPRFESDSPPPRNATDPDAVPERDPDDDSEELVDVDFAEAVGDTLEQAIVNALEILGADEDEVEIEVLEEGKRSFLGMGKRSPFRVRVSWLEDLDEEVIEEEVGDDESEFEDSDWDSDDDESAPVPEQQPSDLPRVASPPAATTPPVTRAAHDGGKPGTRSEMPAHAPRSTHSTADTLEGARSATQGLIREMGFEAEVRAGWRDDELYLEVTCPEGDDALLIGRRGETRAALQHVLQRVISPSSEGATPLLLDINGYWERRVERLVRDAHALARQAVEEQIEVQTEALPPQERRVIHRALVEDGRVRTESGGDGFLKRVSILPTQ